MIRLVDMNKTAVFGLDGGTWNILKPFAMDGTMPCLQKLLRSGMHGRLESTMPAMTAPSWVTFATGKHPGKHGVFDFMLPTDSLGNMKFATSRDIRGATFYEVLHAAGMTPILINLPGTYPPKLHDTITITSLLTQGNQWIFPLSLKKEFPELERYRLTPNESLRLQERHDAYLGDVARHLEEHMAAVKRIFQEKPWDFFFYLFSHTDWVSHLAYTDVINNRDSAAREIFKKIDAHIGWFAEHLPPQTNLLLLSDHGFRSYNKIFYFNKWLKQEGYLTTNTAADQFRGAATRRAKESDAIRQQKKRVNLGLPVFRLFDIAPFLEPAAKWVYHRIVKRYLPVNLTVKVGIDFAKTKVCFPKGSYITNAYINKDWVYTDGTVSREEYPKLRDEVIAKMRAIRDPEGNPVVARVLTREEVYGSDAPEQAPDIFFELGDYWLVGQFHSGKLFGEEIQNKHEKWGIFLGQGPDFRKNETAPDLKMQDITPLLLHLYGLPIPRDCDGKVPTELFDPESSAAQRAPQFLDATTAISEKSALRNAIKNIAI